jgi:hypothetical protein
MIVRRRRSGAMPSSGRGLGANTVLSIDGSRDDADRRSSGRAHAGDVLLVPGS